jgi:hypothetical protein
MYVTFVDGRALRWLAQYLVFYGIGIGGVLLYRRLKGPDGTGGV